MSEVVQSVCYTFTMPKTEAETWTVYARRRCAVCRALDRNPKWIAKLDTLQKMSHVWVATEAPFSCRFASTQSRILQKYFGAAD
jgi:hypothetical protein